MIRCVLTRTLGLLALRATLLSFGLALTNCAGINRQQQEGQNFKDCTFALQSIEQATLAGVDVTTIHSAADLNPADRARILVAYGTGSLPLTMRVNLQVTNPNQALAALNALDYKVLIDGKEVATGATTQRIEVPANSTATLTLPINADAHQLVANGGAEALGGFALGLADRNRQPTRVTIAVRPSVKFLGATIKRPDYLTIDKDITARQLLNNRVTRRDSLAPLRP
ncbi:MAG: LEA type 2 family protein [Janthinobacterium lividum]